MKRVQNTINGIVFFLFLVIGLWVGIVLGMGRRAQITPTPSASASNQHSMLVVGVDDLTARETAVYSIWLVSYSPESPRVFWLPVYPPNPDAAISTKYSTPHKTMMIKPEAMESIARLEVMDKITWDKIIFLDQTALADLLGKNLASVGEFGQTAPLPPWEDPAAAYRQQTNWLELMCTHYTPVMAENVIDTLLSFFGEHVQSSLTYFELISEYEHMSAKELRAYSCAPSW